MANGPRTDNRGQIQTVRKTGANGGDLKSLLLRMGPEIARALPRHVNADRMARIALTALSATPKLAQCTPESFLGCMIQAAQLGLEVNTPLGQAYLLPFDDRRRGTTVCQLIIGYQGAIDLARRSGQVKSIYAFPVYEGDHFRYRLGLSPDIEHVPATDDREGRRMTHVYAVAKLDGGEPIFVVLTRADVERYRGRSRAAQSGPWVTDYEAMALKTAIRRLYRWLPKSAEMAAAAAIDEAPELGRQQLSLAEPEVIGMLQSQGLQPTIHTEPDEPDDSQPYSPVPHDPETGEVAEREPGMEG